MADSFILGSIAGLKKDSAARVTSSSACGEAPRLRVLDQDRMVHLQAGPVAWNDLLILLLAMPIPKSVETARFEGHCVRKGTR